MSVADSSTLARIVERRRGDIAALYGALTPAQLQAMAYGGRPVRDFTAALTGGGSVAVIAEVKKASPSAGPIAPETDAAAQALRYERGGAAAVSVLTEPHSFGGSFDDLEAVAAAVGVPVLCKDFVVGEAQVYAARGRGADAMLLMVSVVGNDVAPLLRVTIALGMQALVEVVSRAELDIAVAAGARLVGVNSRDLHSLRVDLVAARALVGDAASAGVTVVLASGVKSHADVEAAAAAEADAVLVGETLMRAAVPERAVAELAGVPRARAKAGEVS